MFSEQQRDILRETLEWARYNAGRSVFESYDFTNAPVWKQGAWFTIGGHRCYFVSEVDFWADGGQLCGTTACVAGYIVYITRHLLGDDQSPSEEIRDYAERVLDIPEEVGDQLFIAAASEGDVITLLEEALKDDHW